MKQTKSTLYLGKNNTRGFYIRNVKKKKRKVYIGERNIIPMFSCAKWTNSAIMPNAIVKV